MTIKRQAGFALPTFWDEARLFINGQEYRKGEAFFLFRGQANQVKVEVSSDIAQRVRLELAEDNGLNPVASPVFGEWVPPVDDEFSWTITLGDGDSGHLTLVFISLEVELPWVLSCRVMATDLSDEVDGVRVDGAPYPADGVVLFRDEPRTITLTYKPGSPVHDWPLELTATLLSGLKEGDLVVILVGPHTWTIMASNNSGTFKLDLTGAGFTSGISAPVSKVLSRNLADEARVQIDGQDAVDGTVYYRGGVHTLTLVPKPGSPIAGYGVGLWLGRSPLVTCEPAAETFTGVHTWKITLATGRSGLFHFELAGQHFGRGNIKIDANKLLSRDLGDEVTVLLDGVAMPSSGADFTGGQTKTLTLRYTTPDVMTGVRLAAAFVPVTGLVAGDLPSQPRYSEFTTTHQWTLTGAQNKVGTFKLKLYSEEEKSVLVTPTNRLSNPDYSGVTLKFSVFGRDAPLPPQTVIVKTTDVYLVSIKLRLSGDTPLPNAPVEIVLPLWGRFSGTTTANGNFVAQHGRYVTVGVRTITAKAELPDGKSRTVTFLLDVRAP
jgi:hypothetical protein